MKQLAHNWQTPCKLTFKIGYFHTTITTYLATDLRPYWALVCFGLLCHEVRNEKVFALDRQTIKNAIILKMTFRLQTKHQK